MDKINELIWIFRFNYFDFQSRTSRADFWWYMLAITSIHLLFFLSYVVADFLFPFEVNEQSAMLVFGILLVGHLIFWIATLIPTAAITVRRLHDTNRTARWIFVCLFPPASLLMYIFILVWCSEPGDSFGNKYGPVPNSKKLKNPQVAGEF